MAKPASLIQWAHPTSAGHTARERWRRPGAVRIRTKLAFIPIMLLFSDLARQAGVAAQAVQLTAELQYSRERLVAAREEERRRLRRDLHDGVGPLLAGVVLQLGAAKSLLSRDPDAVSSLLDMLRGETQDAIAGIRRIAYDLRPPALDNLGLVGALREQAAHFTSQAGDDPSAESLTVTVDAPEWLPALPAAVEVAGFRITSEAVANVARHAGARTCRVRLTVGDEALEVEIRDDGRGLPQPLRAGVGVTSMRDRSVELGGTLTIESAPDGGTCVRSRLPIAEWQPS